MCKVKQRWSRVVREERKVPEGGAQEGLYSNGAFSSLEYKWVPTNRIM